LLINVRQVAIERGTRLFVCRDVTDLRRAQRNREVLFERSLNPACIAGLDGVLQEVNPACRTLFGYLPEEVLGRSFLDFAHPDDRPAALAELAKIAAGVNSLAFEMRCSCKDGSYRSVVWNAGPIVERGLIFAIGQDITDRRTMESALLEREAQLRQTQKMEAIGQLAGGVAHDFNNLLTVILGNTEIARDPAVDPREREQLLMEVDAAGGRAAALTRKLLAFSRRQVLEPVEVNLNELVADAAKLLRRLIGENIAISMSLADDLGRVLVDRAQLEQIVLNLSVNARDAMPDGGRLTLETQNVDAEALPPDFPRELAAGPYMMLAVSDTGCGIPDEVKPRLFEPFFTTKPKGHGTGMGLAMVFGTVTQSQGHISVSSEVGRGTTFRVYFPRVQTASGEETPHDVDPIFDCGGERILLVEDDEAVRTLAQRILEASGYDVLAASCPSEALALLAEEGGGLDLLLTDVIMPEMSGRELAKLVQERRPQVQVLYTSGHSNSLIARHGVLDDDAVFLEKPFTRDSLTAKVRQALTAPMLCQEPALAS
jgi:two-component system, cell cycle sensor histidine kinase and response regulator CckA